MDKINSKTSIKEKLFDKAENQIRDSQKKVDFDVKEFTIEYYVNKYNAGDFFIPEYQREFVWDEKRQSKFIESVVLGLPVPFIFAADVYDRDDKDDESKEGNFEIVDGSQRIRTLARFVDNNESKTGYKEKLTLKGLEVLDELNDLQFDDFSPARKKRFLNSTIRMIMISDKSDADVRFMMFERINTGSDELRSMERRRGTSERKFLDFISKCTENELFKKLTCFSDQLKKRREDEELILRFFAYSEKYPNFKGNVLDDFVEEKNNNGFDEKDLTAKFQKMLNFVEKSFPNGFLRKKGLKKTPRLRFEAMSVGTILALEKMPELKPSQQQWLNDQEFINEISGNSTNSPTRLESRFSFVQNKLLGRK